MNSSNFGDVGQMRRSSGISMKMMMKEHTLRGSLGAFFSRRKRGRDVQANNAECDDKVGVKDVGDTQGEAEEYAQHSGPIGLISMQV